MPRTIAVLDVEVLRIDRVEQRLEAAQPPASPDSRLPVSPAFAE
ncbi:hypothetical protein ACQ5SB_17820 [Stenotrophomonas geniculata]